jgi:hypothetical protein
MTGDLAIDRVLVSPRRRFLGVRGSRVGLLRTVALLALIVGPVTFPLMQVLIGISLAPFLILAEHLAVPWEWQAWLWFSGAVLAWAAMAWWALRSLGLSKRHTHPLALLATAYAALPWGLLAAAMLSGAID